MATSMKVTVIQPDPLVPLDRLTALLAGHGVSMRLIPLWERDLPPVGEFDGGVIVLGGRMSAHDRDEHPWIDPLSGLLRSLVAADVPTLAICLGHQLLAEALGGRVEVAHPGGGEHGPAEITWTAVATTDPVVAAVAADATSWVAESHHDAVVELPPGATLLAGNDAYPNQAFRVGSALGVQFHPEASPWLMARWARLRGEDEGLMQAAMKARDADVARTGRLLTAGFCRQLRSRLVA